MTSSETASPDNPGIFSASPARRFASAALLLLLLAGLCAPFFIDPVARNAPLARDGVVSYVGWGRLDAPVALKGDWRLVWLTAPAPGANLMVHIPGGWTGPHPGGPTLPEIGAASYQLKLQGLPAGRYTLSLRQAFTARRVFVNGRLLAERGVFGLTPETSRSVHRSQDITIDADGSDIDLRMDVAALHHRDSGFSDAPILGEADGMDRWIALSWLQGLLLVTSLLLLAAYGLVVFLFRPRERASLYFGIACVLLLPFAATLAHDDLIELAAPGLSLHAKLAFQYMTSATAVVLALAYVRELYPRETPRVAYWILQGFNGLRVVIYAGVAMSGDTILLSQVSQWASILRTVAFVSMLGVVVAACMRRRDGALVFAFGLGSFVMALIYSDVVANAHVPPVFGSNLVPVGSLLLLFSQLLILAERWSSAIDTSEQTNMDLRRLLDVNISISSEMQLARCSRKSSRSPPPSSTPNAPRCSCTTTARTSWSPWSPRVWRRARTCASPPPPSSSPTSAISPASPSAWSPATPSTCSTRFSPNCSRPSRSPTACSTSSLATPGWRRSPRSTRPAWSSVRRPPRPSAQPTPCASLT